MLSAMSRGARLGISLVWLAILAACRRDTQQETNGNMQSKAVTGAVLHTNRLAREKSPYLLQHQHNPVDWYAWGDEAFAKARQENKPIFLSIGYSTCHWCHVMERESFESEDVAKFLNAHFVSIKVDREERPDVDRIYMTFVQATTGQGGWPLNVFLTPELKPFFGGTYFPPDSRYGRPSFLQLLQQIQQLWQNRRDDLAGSAANIHAQLEQAASSNQLSTVLLTAEDLRRAGNLFKQSFDPTNGGFGGAPKFPQPSQPQFLLRYAKRFHDDEAKDMVLATCKKMASGGIHDQLGGGFARYSVDAQWLVPHFEKMLYDNAQLVQLYLDAYLVSGDKNHADVVRDILSYVLSDMTHRDGGFYSAEDADSEGHEGKFYCWTQQELQDLLTADEFKVATRYFGVTPQGNFVDHSHPQPLPNQNVLSIADPNLSPAEQPLLKSAKQKMLEVRAKRVRPHLDDKVLASWNGMMLGAFARAHAVLGDEKYRAAAEKNLAFLQAKLWDPKTETLYHRWRDGERDTAQLLEGYAYLLCGTLDLYEATLEPKHLEFAIALAEGMLARFYDSDHGGFWQSAAGAIDLILRVKEDYDGAQPSGNSVAIMGLLRMGKITDRKEFIAAAEKSLRLFASRLQQMPQAVPYLLQALDFSLEEPKRAVLAGLASERGGKDLLFGIHSIYQPNKAVLGNAGPVEPFAKTLPAKDGAVVYVCTGTACRPPTKDIAAIRKNLQ
ncbi:MAG: thioredoxin domain-containing protein [Verrucomicrobia bacterium]|nr:MAG: thioredoxin domain-containing protein [Verrucomicrobiota bacterium]